MRHAIWVIPVAALYALFAYWSATSTLDLVHLFIKAMYQ